MLANFDLNHLLTFPIKETGARQNFLIGALVYLSAFFIPILPVILVTGYLMRILRQVLRGEQPHMVAWDEWSEMFTDGAKLFGVRLVFLLPLFLLLCPLMGLSFAFPFLLENTDRVPEWIALLFPLLMGAFFLLIMPLSIVLGLILPVAEIHVTEKGEFAAGFRFHEWWPIFRANLGGFVVSYVLILGVSFVAGFLVQILYFTIVLCCLAPLALAVHGMYLTLMMSALYAQAYRFGAQRAASAGSAV
jgi:hypothetical protein